jgi:hypothetical protein
MTKEYCFECSKEINTDYVESEECSDCKEVIFCMDCANILQKDPPYVLMCQNCEMDYNDSMNDYDESSEREAIGDREGDYDQYDNRNGW